jgi:triacylglycerol esterase/lipase EstA (alpha/beta hydrolase family)
MLIELLSGNHGDLHPMYFAVADRQKRIRSVVTLGTPYKGTTITDVVEVRLPILSGIQ